eukprot:4656363-Amphidinium_carterae.1
MRSLVLVLNLMNIAQVTQPVQQTLMEFDQQDVAFALSCMCKQTIVIQQDRQEEPLEEELGPN